MEPTAHAATASGVGAGGAEARGGSRDDGGVGGGTGRERATLVAIAVGILVVRVLFSLAMPLLDPDEGRNAEIGREMAVSGDAVIPHLAGIPALDKPPGLFWMEAAFIRALGPTPLAARLPSTLCALAVLLLVGEWARRERGFRFAAIAIGLLATAPLFFVLSAYVIFDMPLALCVTVVWAAVTRELERGPSRSGRIALFAAVAAGILVKGPVMLAWAVGGSAAAALLVRSRDPLRWLAWWPGWLGVVATAGGWFALACLRHPEYPHYAFVEETLGRMTSNQFRRDQPAWFVPVTLVAGTLPWSLATPWRAPATRTERVALGFVLFAAVFFTVSRSKLVTYLVPVLPMLAWMAAVAWTDPERARRATWRVAAVWAVVAIALGLAAGALPPDAVAMRAPAIGFAGAAAIVAAVIAMTRNPAVTLAAALALAPVILAPVATLTVRTGVGGVSGAPLAAAIDRVAGRDARVRYEHCYSPGTDYLRDRLGTWVTEAGHETESNYQLRYRSTLVARGSWTAFATPGPDDADVVVRPARHAGAAPEAFHRDRRFVAIRNASP